MIAPTLRSFVPPALIRAAASATDNDLRDATRFHAAVLFADISGFTRIADAHARRGPAGIDALSSILRAYFGALIDRVARHGGEVLRFAGDAPIALWICPADQLDEALRAAVSCAFSLRDGLRGFDAGDGATLSMRLGVGSGSLLGVRGGGVEGRWEFLVGGAALDDACRAEATVRPGELALSADAWARVGHLLRGAPTRDGAMHVERWRTPPREPHTLPPPPPYDERLTPWVRRFVSRAVLHRLDAGQARWLAELRRVSVLFLSLGEIEFAAPEAPARIDAAVRAIQTEVYRQGGSINQLLVDDKGTVLVAAWGLPAHTHEDDPYRAVRAAMALRATLAAMGLRPSVGVASGRVFCGERGNATRCEYGLIGDRVNLAARLMQHADGAVLCDDATRALTRGVVDYHPARAVSVRHRAEPVEAWEPMDVSPSQSVGRARREGTTFVGRGAERALLDRLLTPATSPDAGALVVVEGEPGIGKSRVVEYACEVATRGGYDVLRGGGDAQSVAAPYHAWQTVFHQVLGVDRQRPRPERAERVRAALRAVDPGLAELVGLLDAVTGLELPDSSRTAEMTGQVRADNTRQLLLRLLSERARTRPTLVVFDDAHWMDSPSLDLLREVHRTARGVTVLVATRPVSDDAPASLLQLRHTADHHLRLAALDAHDTVALACACLGVDALPAAVARLVSERAGGNPLFGEEIALALRDERAITVRDGHCEVDAGRALDALTLPDTLEGIIASRLDRLHPAEQFTLKVASVFGREFGLEALEGVHPMSEARAGLGEQLEHMARLDLVVRLQDAAARRFMFKHALTRDAVYTLLPTEQRQVLHGGVARWLEKALGVDVTLSLGLLAWHWEQAGDAARALDYGDRAGEDALQRGAYREALFFLERARALDVPRHAAPDRLRAVRRERRLGDAWFGLGDMANSRHHLDRALLLAGHPPPDTARAWQRTVVRELGRQAQHLVVPPNHAALDDEQRALLAEVSAVTAAISEQRYYEADIPGWLACTLLSINAAERAGRLDAAGRGYMGVGYLAGLLRLKPLSRRWFDRALALG